MRLKWNGEKLKQRRKVLGLTMEELSTQVGTKHSHVSMWEAGKCEPQGSKLVLISKALNEAPDYFYDEVLEVPDENIGGV